MTFGEKLKQARLEAGYTQDELANKLLVSRAAIAKWEGDRGIPDITNLKAIAELFGMSIDYLLDDGSTLDLSVTKKAIDLTKFGEKGRISRLKKSKIKDQIIHEEYPKAEVLQLTVIKIKNTKQETIADQIIGWLAFLLGDIPLFGTQEFGKVLNSFDQQYYLVNEQKVQHFVLLTDEYMVSRTLKNKIVDKQFEIGDRKFQVVGKVK